MQRFPVLSNMVVATCTPRMADSETSPRLTGCMYAAQPPFAGRAYSVRPDPRLLRHRGSAASAMAKTSGLTGAPVSGNLLEYQARS